MKMPDRRKATLIAIVGVLLGILISVLGAVREAQTLSTAGTVVMVAALLFWWASVRGSRSASSAAPELPEETEEAPADEENEDEEDRCD